MLLGAGLTDVEAQGCSFRTIATRGVGEHQDLLTGGHGDGQPPMAESEWISGAAPRRFATLPIRCGPSGETYAIDMDMGGAGQVGNGSRR